jgi:PucR family transcriptional regulator, purine catabolism regulatory protein
MAITVGDLVQMGHLGCEVIAGSVGLDREIRWAHVCELKDPLPWLTGGELVMTTGLAIPRHSEGQERYLSRLAASGAAGLAISKDLHAPPLSPGFIEAADRLAFPMLTVSIEVTFIDIARVVIMANSDESHRQLVRQLAVFDVLRSTSVTRSDFPALFERLEHVSGYRLYLSSPAGMPFVPGVPSFPEDRRELLSRPATAPAQVPGGYMVSVPCEGKTAGYLLGLRKPDVDPAGLGALQHIATIAALERAMLEREREIERRQGSELLAELFAAAHPESLEHRLPPALVHGQLALTLVRTADPDATGSLLHYELTDLGLPHLLQVQQDLALLTLADQPVERVLDSAQVVAAGRSRPFRLRDSLALARRQASAALQRALQLGTRIVDASSIPEELDWLPREPAAVAALVQRVLGALLDYDLAHDGSLVPTLRTWFESGQRPSLVARRLGVHPHTLSYRLGRIQELTGRDLRSPGTAAEIWLALRASDASMAAGRLPSGLPPGHRCPYPLAPAEAHPLCCDP